MSGGSYDYLDVVLLVLLGGTAVLSMVMEEWPRAVCALLSLVIVLLVEIGQDLRRIRRLLAGGRR